MVSVCAERNAVAMAVAAGAAVGIRAVAVVTDADDPTPPCGGAARSSSNSEGPAWRSSRSRPTGRRAYWSLDELLPDAFGPSDLDRPVVSDPSGHRAGIVAVVGRPNVGKSTLVNALVGEKVAIVSDKPQTTRRDIRAIRTTDDVQVVFHRHAGVSQPRTALGARLNDLVSDAVEGVDVVVQVVDAASGVGRGDAYVPDHQVASANAGARICVVNKIDRMRHHELIPQLAAAGRRSATGVRSCPSPRPTAPASTSCSTCS